MNILKELKFAGIFFTGCFIMFFAIQSVKAQTYSEYRAELDIWKGCSSSYFSGAGECGKEPRYQSCQENFYFSGGECKPLKPTACAVYSEGTLYIEDIDIIIDNKLSTFTNIRLYWNGSAFGLSK